MLATSFECEVVESCQVLVLGSMPGIVSLNAVEYYANMRNAFWPIIQQLVGVEACLPYAQRLRFLNQANIGLWDVYQQCEREGSLDSAINKQSAKFNHIAALLPQLPHLRCIACNGQAAFKAFKQLVKTQQIHLDKLGISVLSLPSTSPAYAAMPFENKVIEWQALIPFLTRE